MAARWALTVASLQADHLYRLDEAAATVQHLLVEQPRHADAWERLRGLCLRRGDGERLAEAVRGLADSAAPALEVSILEMGARDVARLGAVEPAIGLWKRVLERAPGRPAALDALQHLAERRRDAQLRAETIAQRAQAAEGDEKAALLCELGALHRDVRGDHAAAETAYRAALEANPKNLDALEAVVTLARLRGDGPALDELTDRLHKLWKKSRAEATRTRLAPLVGELLLRRAQQLGERGEPEAQLKQLEQGWSVAPRHVEVGQALADAYQARHRLADAARIYADLPAPAAEGADAAERKAAEHLRRGHAFQLVGDDPRAVRHFEAAAHLPGTRLEALAALAALHEVAGQWEAAVRIHIKLAELPGGPGAASLVHAGRLVELRLSKASRATGLYAQAVRAGLNDPALLEATLPALREHGQLAEAQVVVDRLLVLAQDAASRGRLLAIRTELKHLAGDPEAAGEARRASLAEGPIDLDSARSLLEHLDESNPAEQLQILSQVRTQLAGERSPRARALLETLATALEAHGDLQGAIEAYATLLARDARHLPARRALARLYQALAEAAPDEEAASALADQALEHQLAVVRAAPVDAAAVRVLADLQQRCHQPAGRLDALSALEWLRVATPEESAERSLMAAAPPPVVLLDVPGRRERITLAAVDREPAGALVQLLFAQLGPDFDALFGGAPAQAPPGAIAAEDDPALADDVVRVRAALGLTEATIWVAGDNRPPGIWRVHPPQLVVGRQWLAGTQRRRIYQLAHALELSRGAALLAAYAPEDEARALFGAALVLALGDDGLSFAREVGASPAPIPVWLEFLETRIDASVRARLERLVASVVATGPSAFHQWVEAVHLTANRVAFVLSGDLGLAAEHLREAAPGARGRRDHAEDLRSLLDRVPGFADLHAFAFGDALLALRRLLSRADSRPPAARAR